MKILFQSRKTLFSVAGGDTIQILKTAEALRNLGCKVDISLDLEPDVKSYDIVHLFNLMRPQETWLQARNAKRQYKPVALSTIYVSYYECDRATRTGLNGMIASRLSEPSVEFLKTLARAVKNLEINKGTLTMLTRGYAALQKNLLNFSDVFLPNSESEMMRVIDDFGESVTVKPYVVVPNAVDVRLFTDSCSQNISSAKSRFDGCVLCVARIEKRKNQLNLVRAMEELPWDLVLIGKVAPNHLKYFKDIQQVKGKNVYVLGEVLHHNLPKYYRAARVHVLPSWMETTGLSSLEAGAMGCNLVITDKGDTRDYFGDFAFYCEPDDVNSICDAICRAYEAPYPNQTLQEHILSYFTWEKAAEKTLEGYRLALMKMR